MPGRYIREGLLDSERFDALRQNGGVQAQLFFTLLLLVVDDYGRCKNHPIWLRSKAFPLRDDIRETDISRWIAACEKSGLIALYGEPNGTAFLQVYNFGQQARSKSKYPDPPPETLCAMQKAIQQEKDLQNIAKHCKTSLPLNDNGNDNGNDKFSLPDGSEKRTRPPEQENAFKLERFPESAADVLQICAAINSPMTLEQAQAYLDQRTVADWHQGAGGTGRKIILASIPADIRRWIARDKADTSRAAALKQPAARQRRDMVNNSEGGW